MLKTLTLAGLAGLSLSLSARAEDVSLSAGRQLAVERCGGCHAVYADGESPNPRAPRFRDLGRNFPFDGLREALMTGMIVGHPQMPIQHLTRIESGDVIAYLQSLQKRPAALRRGGSQLRPLEAPGQ